MDLPYEVAGAVCGSILLFIGAMFPIGIVFAASCLTALRPLRPTRFLAWLQYKRNVTTRQGRETLLQVWPLRFYGDPDQFVARLRTMMHDPRRVPGAVQQVRIAAVLMAVVSGTLLIGLILSLPLGCR
jgi:hypothetical protein